jgi:hypothetical protein
MHKKTSKTERSLKRKKSSIASLEEESEEISESDYSYYHDSDSDYESEESGLGRKNKKRVKEKLRMNVLNLSYDVIRDTAVQYFNFKLTEDEECDWDIFWVDYYVKPEFMSKMKPY